MIHAETVIVAETKCHYQNGPNGAEIETNKLVIISENLSLKNLPKKPAIIDANRGKNNIKYPKFMWKYSFFQDFWCIFMYFHYILLKNLDVFVQICTILDVHS